MHLRWHILCTDVGVVAGQGIALQAEGAYPDLCSDVDVAERIEDGSTGGLADNRLVLQNGLVEFFDRGEKGTVDGSVSTCSLEGALNQGEQGV